MNIIHIFSVIANSIEMIIVQGGYTILFAFTFLEGVPVLGMIIPGHVAIIASGFLAKLGTFNLFWIIVIASIGAICGDYLGFYLGRKYGMSFIDRLRPYIFITDSQIDKARNLLSKHTGKTLIIGRLMPATRALMPFLVGTTHLPAIKFWMYNIIGGVVWVVSSIMLGYLFGASYDLISGYVGRVVFFAIILAIIIVWGYKFVNTRFHIFRKYELFTLTLNVLSLWALAATVDKIFDQSSPLGFDVWISNFFCSSMHPVNACVDFANIPDPALSISLIICTAAAWISIIGGTVVMGGLGVLSGIMFAFAKKWRSSLIMLMSVGATAVAVMLMKYFFMSSRPQGVLANVVVDPSFPSGHAAMAAAFFVAFIYLMAPKISSLIKRELMIVISVIIVIVIGVSRLVLNVHWFSDVVAGWSLGIFISTLSILFIRYIGSIAIKNKHV